MRSLLQLARRLARVRARAEFSARHDYECIYLPLKARLQERLGPALQSARVLDFGCGYTCSLPLLLAGDVGEIVGADVAPVFRDGLGALVRWSGGLSNPGETSDGILHFLRAGPYHRGLRRRHKGLPSPDQLNVIRYDGRRLPFQDSSFDCIVSNAVLQELPLPLEEFAAEMARVLRPGGLIDLEWHSFYSWSGHYLGQEESRRNPWGHLRGGRYHPSLNRANPDQVVAAFSGHFRDLIRLAHDSRHRIAGRDPDYEQEGTAYLTPRLEAELPYPREWLLTRGYILQGIRP